MQAIQEVTSQNLQWKHPKWWKREFELRSGDELLARLFREKHTRRIIGEAADGQWTFKRQGFWRVTTLIIDLASQNEIATLKRERKTILIFSDGRVLTWKRLSLWRGEWDWLDSDGRPLIHFQRGK